MIRVLLLGLLLAGSQELEVRIRCLDLGADDFMMKPFSLSELRARCRALLRRCRELKLRAVGSDRQLRTDFTVLLTAKTVHSLYSPLRRQWIAL